VKNDAAHELNIEVSHSDRTSGSFPNKSEDLVQFRIEQLLDDGGALLGIIGKILYLCLHLFAYGGKAFPELVIG
jgi:hypothetical protein